MSVLSAVRSCVVSGHRARVDGDVAHLSPGVSLPRKSVTAWRYRKDDYLTLDSILFFLDNERLRLSEYVKACNAAGVQVIPFGERKALLEYIRGAQDSNTYIDHDKEQQQQQSAQPNAQQPQHAHAQQQGGVGTAAPSKPNSSAAAPGTGTAVRDATHSSTLTGRKRPYNDAAGDDDGSRQPSDAKQPTANNNNTAADPSASSPNAAALPPIPPASSSSPSFSSLPASLRPPSSWQLSECVAEERQYLTRVSCLQANNDFSAVIAAWDEAQSRRAQKERYAEGDDERRRKAAKTEQRHAASAQPSSSSSSRPSGGGSGNSSRLSTSQPSPSASLSSSAPQSSAGGIPIIVVPSSLSSCLTLYNARDFLESGQLTPTAEKRAAMSGVAKPPFIRLQRPSCVDKQRVVSFDVLDDVSQLRSSDDWRRVVAVFVNGSAWQFDGWPAPFTSPAAIFAHLSAFYLHYSDEPLNKNVQQWRVHRLTAHRDKHHHDRSLQLEFWNTLAEHLKCNNRHNKLNI